MNCKSCNAKINEGSNVSPFCGAKTVTSAPGIFASVPQKKVILCTAGLHYYDSAEFPSCPHCAEEGVNAAPTSVNTNPIIVADMGKKKKKEKEKKEKKPLFSFGKKQAVSVVSAPVVNSDMKHAGVPDSSKTVALLDLEDDEEYIPAPVVQPDAPLTAKKAVTRHGAVQKQAVQPAVQQPVEAPVQASASASAIRKEGTESTLLQNQYTVLADESVNAAPVQEETVVAVMEKPFPKPKASDSSKTVAIYSDISDEEPVVGWLVCVKGINFGQSFNLVSGVNTIGRSPAMDVDLSGEESVSRNTHASIIYDPKNRQFIIKAGDSKRLTYVNNELVIEHKILSSYNKIQLGDCELMFVPFCGDSFTWDTYRDE